MQQRRIESPDRLQFTIRKRGRAVEGTGLENRRWGNPFVSSNLTASATPFVSERFNKSQNLLKAAQMRASRRKQCFHTVSG